MHPHKILDETILTKKSLANLIVEALIDGDMELVKEVLIAQILIRNKADLVRKSNLGRQTLYDLIEDKREFNPTLKTLSSLLKAFAA